MAVEIEHLRTLTMLKLHEFKGQRSFLEYSSAAASFCQGHYNTPFPDTDDAPLAKVAQMVFNPRGPDGQPMKGLCLIVFHYNPSNWGWGAIPETEPQPARLWLRSFAEWEEVTHDLDGKVIVGPEESIPAGTGYQEGDPPQNPFNAWYLVKGNNQRVVNRAVLRLETAAPAALVDPAAYADLAGTINDTACPNIANADTNELLMMDFRMQQSWGDPLVYMDIFMALDRRGWNELAESRLGTWQVRDVPDASSGSADFAGSRKSLFFVPGLYARGSNTSTYDTIDSPASEPRRMFDEADWSVIAAMPMWTQ